jgi:T5SS/PEP-CTERM-associated repeat protein
LGNVILGNAANAAGTLVINSGGTVTGSTAFIGYVANSTGTVVVNGPGATLITGSSLRVGNTGSGLLTVQNGGVVSVGNALISGTSPTAGQGIGTINILSGGQVSVATNWYLGYGAGSTAAATIDGTGSIISSGGVTSVGYSGTGTLNVRNGAVVSTSGVGYLGYNAGSPGTATVDGAGAQWNLLSTFQIGGTGTGVLNIQNGGVVSTSSVGYLGYGSGGVGTVTVSGNGSQWNLLSTLQIGASGTGTLNIQNGGVVSTASVGYLGYASGGVGTVTVSGGGSQWNLLSMLQVGSSGTGTLTIQNGGQVNVSSSAYVGLSAPGGNGTVVITGTGSQLTATGGVLFISGNSSGAGGTGILTVADGGSLRAKGIRPQGSNATLNLTGGTITTGTIDLSLGGTFNFTGGTLISTSGITVTAGQTLNVGGTLVGAGAYAGNIAVPSGGTLAGSFSVAGAVTSSGTLSPGGAGTAATLTLGSLVLNGGTLHFDLGGAGNSDRLSIAAAPTINAATTLDLTALSGFGIGTYTLISGYTGAITTGFGSLSTTSTLGGFNLALNNASGALQLVVTGDGTPSSLVWSGASTGIWNTADANWTGTSNPFKNGDNVTFNDTTAVTTVTIGTNVSPGSITVSTANTYTFAGGGQIIGNAPLLKQGTGTLVLNATAYTNTAQVKGGTLRIADGGSLVTSATGYVGLVSGDVGTVTVSGAGSQWLLNGVLNIGTTGVGTLNVQNGGAVSNSVGNTFLGVGAAGNGTAIIDGVGSQLTTSAFFVGYSGLGALTVQNGGLVTTLSIAYVGDTGSSPGSVLVMGSGSQWNVGSTLIFGVTGSGTLTVADGGRVAGASTIYLSDVANSSGTATVTGSGSLLTGGKLVVGYVGKGALTVAGGGQVVTSGSSVISNSPGASGTVLITGTGSQWFNTGNVYVGGSTALAGGPATVTVTDNGSLNVSGLLRLYNTGTLNLAGGSIAANTLDLTGAGSNFNFTGGTLTISGGIVADAAYTLSLGGGQTLVDNGTISTTVVVGNGGMLAGNGTYGNNLSVQSGGTLAGSLSVTGAVTSAGAISPGGNGAAGTLTLNTLILSGGALNFDLGSIGASDQILFSGGLAPTAGADVTLNFASLSGFGTGTYTLLSGYGTNVLGATDFAHLLYSNNLAGYTLTLHNNAGALTLEVTGGSSGPHALTWAGNVDGAWNTTTANWTGEAATYAAGDHVTFGNTSGTTTVAITAGGAAPGAVVVNNDALHPYAFTGGAISGTTTLVKQGGGTLTLSNDNTFTGATTVAGGTLAVAGAFASPSIDVGGNVLQFITAGTQTIGSLISGTGILQKLGSGTTALTAANTFSGTTSVDAGTLVVDHALGGTIYVNAGGAFLGSGVNGSTVVFAGGSGTVGGTQTGTTAVNSGTVTVTSGGTLAGLVAVSGGTLNVGSGGAITGSIALTAGSLSVFTGGTASSTPGITVGSAGTFHVAGGSVTGNGPISVAGRFVANGAVAASSLTVESGGTLSGSGSVVGTVVVADGGNLSPGNSIESLAVGNLTLSGGANLYFEFKNAGGSTPGTDWDLVDLGAAGILDLGDATAVNPIHLYVDSWKLDNSGHGGGLVDGPNFNGFDPQSSYEWLFVKAADLAHLATAPTDDDLSRRFQVVDDVADAGVFGLGDGNPFDRPSTSMGQGTFRVVWDNGPNGPGLYVRYSAIPEPGTLTLAALASLGAGWYGRRRRRNSTPA